MKIKTKVSYIVLLVIVITGITAISISGFVSRNLIKNEIYNHLDNVAHSKAHHIETLFIECQDIVKILATEKIFLETGADAQDLMMQRINEIIHINKKITHISIVDQNAKIIVPDDNHTRNYQEFIISSQKGTYLKDIHISPLTGKHIISISTPILQEGKLVRLLIIDIDVENSLYNITKDRTGLGKTGEIYLLNHEGYMISPSRFLKDTFLNIQVTSPKAQECLGRDTQNNTYLDYRGNIVIGTSHFIEGMNWCLIAEIEAAEAFAPVDKLIWMIFLFFLMPLSVGILFALIMTETITRPISLLHKKIRGIEEGNWDYNIIIESHDEIGELSKSFDIMTEHLKVSRQRLETRRDELEKQVIARTLELDQKVETLRHSEERFRKIFEDGPIGMAIINKEQSFLKVNSAFANMVGYTASELIGQTITDISYPDDMPQNRAFMTQALKGERTYFQMEKRYIKKDGQIIWGNLAVSLLHNQEGEPIYFLAKVEDITKRKLADEEIRKLSIAIKQSPSISLITDLQGHIEYVNPKFTQVTGYTAEEVIGKNPRFLRSDDTDQQFYKKLWKTLFSGGELRSEFQNRKKNGEVYWEFASFSAIKNKEGTITHFLKVAEDITERKKAEFSLKEAKEVAVSANRAKSEFLANMSHEIRTPMNAVLGFSELLSSLITDKKHKGYLDAIQTAGKNLLILINDILDLAKIEAGKLDIQYDLIDPSIIFRELEQLFSLKIRAQKIDFIIDIDNALPKAIQLDETRLRQVLLNLVGNAIKFTENGHVKLKVYTEQTAHQNNLIITIEDTGIGIPENQQDSIFESFKQQEGQSTRKYGGTGLGLAISKRLVEKMNGHISLSSTVGKGSIFKITLQDIEISTTPIVETQDTLFSFKNLVFEKALVLIVDDIQSNRDILREWLFQANLDVIEAEDGQKTLDYAETQHPNLIIMDIRMPGLDGYDTIKKLRQNLLTQDIPIIALTASITQDNQEKITKHGFDGFLIKPIKMQDLFTELALHLKHTTHRETETLINILSIDKDQLPIVIKTLEEVMMPIWEEMKGLIEMEAINHFAQEIIQYGTTYHTPTLIHYGEILNEYVQEFDISQIEMTLDNFPVLVKQFKEALDDS